MAATRNLCLLFILAFLYIASTAGMPGERILEGNNAVIDKYPWIVSVRVDNAHIAVGNIISDSHILTSGHGLSEMSATAISPSRVSVRVGSINQYAGGQIYSIQSITIHPSYGNFLHDIAIITLSDPLSFTNRIAPIVLATNETDSKLAEDTEISIAGWGLQLSGASSYKLQQTTLRVLSKQFCEYEVGFGYDSVLCQHDLKQGISRGDDGAGVVYNNTLVGVASFYFGGSGTILPDVSTRVSYYKDWITKITDGKANFESF